MGTTRPKPVRRLKDLLKEQQEPFVLEVYLSERGYPGRRLNSIPKNGCNHGDSSNFVETAGSGGSLNKSKKGSPYSSKVLGVVCNKVLAINDLLSIKNSDSQDGKSSFTDTGRKAQEAAEPNRDSSSRSTTRVYNSYTNSDTEETSTSLRKECTWLTGNTSEPLKLSNPRGEEAAADGKLPWRCIEWDDGKQDSPVSVLEDMLSHTARKSSIARQEENPSGTCAVPFRNITEDSILSASLWKLLLQSATEKPTCRGVAEIQAQEVVQSAQPFLKMKRVLQQTKQLLFDCVREAVEIHGREGRHQRGNVILGSEELGKIICGKIKLWGEQSGDESNIAKLLEVEFSESASEWYCFVSLNKKIATEIGDAILEEIKHEIVIELTFL